MGRIARLVVGRLLIGLATLFVVSLVIFLGVELLPGDFAEAVLGRDATPETLRAFREALELDEPPLERYLGWLGGMVRGELGRSLSNQREISDLIGARLGNTLFLAAYAALVSVPLALCLGILAALYRNTLYDRLVSAATLTSISFPEFFVAYLLIFLLAVKAGLFPSISNISAESGLGERIYRATLPALTLILVVVAHMMRMTRAAIVDLMESPYIEMATLKGLKPSRIVVKHALPNALAPIINVVLLNLGYLVVGVVIVEVVFVYPGLGQLLVDSVSTRDVPVVQAASLIFATTYIVLNLTADVLSTVTNPRLLHPK